MHLQKGNICKHKAKVLHLLCLELAEGTMARYCSALNGMTSASPGAALNLYRAAPESCLSSPILNSLTLPFRSQTTTTCETQTQPIGQRMDPHYNLQMQARALLDLVDGNLLLIEHLEASFNMSLGEIK